MLTQTIRRPLIGSTGEVSYLKLSLHVNCRPSKDITFRLNSSTVMFTVLMDVGDRLKELADEGVLDPFDNFRNVRLSSRCAR